MWAFDFRSQNYEIVKNITTYNSHLPVTATYPIP